ncbi:hypothetical protein ACJ41O_005880 [Fusarium nematophilum]
MSYDLHGAWDQHVNWTKPYLNAHTNLTEIESALDLLWRNDISPSKVVMGLGFYGRAFTVESASCKDPGCLFNGPANAGSCSREKGILLNSEIQNEIKKRKLKPKLYEEEAVKVVTWSKQWVSYDDEQTLQIKVDRAGERCLGGIMYGHGNGACTKSTSCPSGMTEIGSNQIYCNHPPMVQTACCTTESESMKVYGECTWGAYPECDSKPECPFGYRDVPVARSGSGSGGLQCKNLKNAVGNEILGVQMRSYCCGRKPDLQFTDCQIFRNVSPMIPGYPKGTYRSNCPSDRVRVAIDWAFHVYSAYEVGGQATCCKTEYGEEKWEANEKLEAYKDSMAEWMVDEYCPNPSKVLKKRGLSSSSTELAVRADNSGDMTPLDLLTRILSRLASDAMLPQLYLIWNTAIRERHFYLQVTYMSNYIRNNWRLDWEGPAMFARKVLCYPAYWAAQIEAFLHADKDGGDTLLLNCTESGLCYSDGDCGELADNKRRHAALFGRHSNHLSHSSHHYHHHHRAARAEEPGAMLRFQKRPAASSIEKRLKPDDKSKAQWKQDARVIIGRIRGRFSVFTYMNLPETLVRLNKIVKDIYVQLKFAENVYNKRHPGENVQLANYWLEWITDYYAKVVIEFKENITDMVAQIHELMEDGGVDEGHASQMREMMAQFQEMADDQEDKDTEIGGT